MASSAVALTLAATFIWGTSFNVNDYAVHELRVPWATFVLLRFVVASVSAFALAWALGRELSPALLRDPWLWALGAANAGAFLLQYAGQTLTTPAKTALLVNTSLFLVALLSYLVFRERFPGPKAAIALAAVAGVVAVTTEGDPRRLAGGDFRGDLLVLGASLSYAFYTILNKHFVEKRVPLAPLLAWTFVASAALSLPVALLVDGPRAAASVGVGGWLAVLYTGLVCSTVAYALWTLGLRTLTATVSSLFVLAEILVATVLSVGLGRETLSPVAAGGAALLAASIVALAWRTARAPRPAT